MSAPGTQIINVHLFDSLIARINAAQAPADLQRYVDDAFAPISQQLAFIRYEISMIAPIVELVLNPPTADPAKIVTWLKDLIAAQLQPKVEAYYAYAQQITELTAKAAELQSAVRAAEQRIGNISVNIPPIA